MRLLYSKKHSICVPHNKRQRPLFKTLLLCSALSLTGCSNNKLSQNSVTGQTLNEGYIFEQNELDFVGIKSSMDQVLLVMGSPTFTQIYGHKIFYYVYQKRYRPVAFLKPSIVERLIVAIYFNNKDEVQNIVHYTLQNGKIINFSSHTTPTTGRDRNIFKEIFSNTTFMPIDLQR